jgi:hypothetical protein
LGDACPDNFGMLIGGKFAVAIFVHPFIRLLSLYSSCRSISASHC